LELKDCVIELLEQAKSRKKLPPTHGRASQNPAEQKAQGQVLDGVKSTIPQSGADADREALKDDFQQDAIEAV
jgi:hypothetical protein